MASNKNMIWIIAVIGVVVLVLLLEKGEMFAILPEEDYNEYGDCEFLTNVDPIDSPAVDYYGAYPWIMIDYDNDGDLDAFGCQAQVSDNYRLDRCGGQEGSTLLIEDFNSYGDDIYVNRYIEGYNEESVFICNSDGTIGIYCQTAGALININNLNMYPCNIEAVIFRTSDLSYGTDSAIAYSDTCGNTLTAYGESEIICSSGEHNPPPGNLIDITLPGQITHETWTPVGESKLYFYSEITLIVYQDFVEGSCSTTYFVFNYNKYNVLTTPTHLYSDDTMAIACLSTPKTCSELGGTICDSTQTCSTGSFTSASDTTRCCVGGICETQPCNTDADTDCDGIVSRDELGVSITQWINGEITRTKLGEIIVAWVG